MKIASFTRAGASSYGLVEKGRILEVDAAFRATYPDLRSVLAAAAVDAMAKAAHQSGQSFGLSEVALTPPIPNAGKIICVGLNYRTHIIETGRDMPRYPILFTRYADSLVGDGAPLVLPRASEQLDFEGELAFVIGRTGRHVKRADALQYVAGYSCFNDGSIRDFQQHTLQWTSGKNFWRSGSFGPWLVTADEVGPLAQVELVTRLNGAEMQRARLDDLVFDVAALIEYITTICPLEPGDVVATGTTGGCGGFRKPPIWMRAGDVVEVEIGRIGTLTNGIVSETDV
jgi:2-keto-4-pentenoate hydratase/2-oxohepta-3-ene-1,7-dioic acid hydratase in catechol pathway